MAEEYSRSQLEDKTLKSICMFYGQELFSYLKIGKRILRMLPTEQIRLEAVRRMEDTLFETDDDTLAHFEFESVEVTDDDLRRFRMYDAHTGMIYRKPVITYVLCSGKVTKIHSVLEEELNTYRVIPLGIKKENADELFSEMEGKIRAGSITRADIVPMMLTPLMSGKSSIRDRILRAQGILNREGLPLRGEDRQRMESVLYAFACKFLERKELNEIREAFSMTVLGEMIWSDGEKKGMEKGSFVKLITLVCRKFQKGKTPAQIAEDLEEDPDVVEQICKAAEKCAPEYDCEEIYRLYKAAGQ